MGSAAVVAFAAFYSLGMPGMPPPQWLFPRIGVHAFARAHATDASFGHDPADDTALRRSLLCLICFALLLLLFLLSNSSTTSHGCLFDETLLVFSSLSFSFARLVLPCNVKLQIAKTTSSERTLQTITTTQLHREHHIDALESVD